jgi:hypothetical protein
MASSVGNEGMGAPRRSRRKLTVDVLEYDPSLGVGTYWDEESRLRVEVTQSPRSAVISGNRAGLASLARHLLSLAQPEVPSGSHLDFDEYGGWLDAGFLGLRIEVE